MYKINYLFYSFFIIIAGINIKDIDKTLEEYIIVDFDFGDEWDDENAYNMN